VCWGRGSSRPSTAPCPRFLFIKAVHGPLPQIPLVPTGGITADNAGEFIRAGAALVCAGSWLVDKKAVAAGKVEVLRDKARRLVAAVQEARKCVSPLP